MWKNLKNPHILKRRKMKKMKIKGYRTEDYSGEGFRDTLKVANHEISGLGNSDIKETIKKLYDRSDFRIFLKEIYSKGYRNSIWLCKTKKDLKEEYWTPGWDIDKYIINDGIILSDLRSQGILVAYKGKPEITYSV
jgi:hypothetical protein